MSLFKNRFVPETYKNSVSDVIPGQAMSANELWERFNRGQRLVINQRPVNLYPSDADGNFIDPSIKDEDFNNVMPDIDDPVDLEDYIEESQRSKKEIQSIRADRKKKEEQKKEEPKKEE